MRKWLRATTLPALLAGLFLLACDGADSDDESPPVSTTAEIVQADDAADAAANCDTTSPNRQVPPATASWQPERYHGDGLLWVILEPSPYSVGPGSYGLGEDGALTIGFQWWTAPDTEPLVVEAQRLDGPAPIVRWDKLGERLEVFYMHMDFPTEGCWQVTGRSGNHSLTFVISIERLPDHPDAVVLADTVGAVTAHVISLYPDAVLREIELDASGIGEWAVFRFVAARGACSTAICEIGVRLQSVSSEPATWQIGAPRPIRGNDVDLESLEPLVVLPHQPGVAAVRERLAEHWSDRIEMQGVPDCSPRQLKLEYVSTGVGPEWITWTSSCALSGGGIVQRRIDPLSGIVSNVPSFPGGTCLVAGC